MKVFVNLYCGHPVYHLNNFESKVAESHRTEAIVFAAANENRVKVYIYQAIDFIRS